MARDSTLAFRGAAFDCDEAIANGARASSDDASRHSSVATSLWSIAISRTVGILIDRWQPDRGGAERALEALARALTARGDRVRVYALDAPGTSGTPRAPDTPRTIGDRGAVEVTRVAVPTWTRFSRSARERALAQALADAAGRDRCDVTVGVRHLARVDLYWPHGGSHVASLAAARSAGAGRRIGASEVAVRGRHRAFVELERALLDGGGARRVACVSSLVHAELAREYPAARERLVTIGNGVDTERFHPRERERSGARLRHELGVARDVAMLTFVARHPLLKGLRELCAALAGARERSFVLVVAGSKHVARWRTLARRSGLDPARVRFLADVDPVAIASASDLAVHPTWRDTCGMVVLEAASSGTPVVTTRLAGASEIVASGAQGTVIRDPTDGVALREAIEAWLDRIRSGEVDRTAVRAAVEGRDRARWLGMLQSEIDALARKNGSTRS